MAQALRVSTVDRNPDHDGEYHILCTRPGGPDAGDLDVLPHKATYQQGNWTGLPLESGYSVRYWLESHANISSEEAHAFLVGDMRFGL